jgi:hypothetical protein
MMGLAYVVFFAVYLLVSIAAVRGAIGYARKKGKSAKRWGWGAAFVMYSLVFWDWLPTVAVHQFYCAKDSGFWVYKTLEQWKAENPGVMDTFTENKTSPARVGDDENHTDTQTLNQRFRWTTEKRRLVFLLPIYRLERKVVDVKNDEVIARHINFSSGKGRDNLKFWMNIQNRTALYRFVELIVKANKGDAK